MYDCFAFLYLLQENTCLKKINLAWNGLYLDGCKALAKALEENSTLIELDLTCNRISKECLDKLMMGLRKNTTLEILRVGEFLIYYYSEAW